jgi:hypothetical protein
VTELSGIRAESRSNSGVWTRSSLVNVSFEKLARGVVSISSNGAKSLEVALLLLILILLVVVLLLLLLLIPPPPLTYITTTTTKRVAET